MNDENMIGSRDAVHEWPLLAEAAAAPEDSSKPTSSLQIGCVECVSRCCARLDKC
jgi:hypothetical protein